MTQSHLMRASVVKAGTVSFNQTTMCLALFDTSGTALNVGTLAAAVADNGTFTSAVAAGATPTKAEFDALRADALAVRTTLNGLLASLRAAGIIAE